MVNTSNYRILPGTGNATISTLCNFYRELIGGRVVPKKPNMPPCEYHETNVRTGYCTHYFCPMCTYLPKENEK